MSKNNLAHSKLGLFLTHFVTIYLVGRFLMVTCGQWHISVGGKETIVVFEDI